jgi:LmbE family N-acetylglucosaminyl deacetylase
MRLLAVVAHPDDESLGLGGTLARYASEGVQTFLITATRGERGRNGASRDASPVELGALREAELMAAARVLGLSKVHLLDYGDGRLDEEDASEATAGIAALIRGIQPDVVLTFAPDGAYGHPDHIAICQLTTAAVMQASQALNGQAPHLVRKLYYMAWTSKKWDAYQAALKRLIARVDGVERHAVPWPDWAVTTVIDTADHAATVWRAVSCHQSQMSIYRHLEHLPAQHHRALWGSQEFYRVFSLVNGGRKRETDLFEGLRDSTAETRASA